jgi:hypothetical protein
MTFGRTAGCFEFFLSEKSNNIPGTSSSDSTSCSGVPRKFCPLTDVDTDMVPIENTFYLQ